MAESHQSYGPHWVKGMMSDQKYFTVDQANRTLPLVSRIVGDIIHEYADWKDKVRQYEMLVGAVSEETPDQVALRQRVEDLAARINGYIQELSSIGCLFKGFEEGLVDFLGRRDDRDVFWCWKFGEPRVQHWHEVDAGFAGRQPLATSRAHKSTS
jgi:hypothetical protein